MFCFTNFKDEFGCRVLFGCRGLACSALRTSRLSLAADFCLAAEAWPVLLYKLQG